MPDYSNTAAVWTRGILSEQYGVKWSDLNRVVSGRRGFEALAGLSMEKVETDLETDLIEGQIDAFLTPSLNDNAKPASERLLRSVIADVQAAEENYLRRFGVYPSIT